MKHLFFKYSTYLCIGFFFCLPNTAFATNSEIQIEGLSQNIFISIDEPVVQTSTNTSITFDTGNNNYIKIVNPKGIIYSYSKFISKTVFDKGGYSKEYKIYFKAVCSDPNGNNVFQGESYTEDIDHGTVEKTCQRSFFDTCCVSRSALKGFSQSALFPKVQKKQLFCKRLSIAGQFILFVIYLSHSTTFIYGFVNRCFFLFFF